MASLFPSPEARADGQEGNNHTSSFFQALGFGPSDMGSAAPRPRRSDGHSSIGSGVTSWTVNLETQVLDNKKTSDSAGTGFKAGVAPGAGSSGGGLSGCLAGTVPGVQNGGESIGIGSGKLKGSSLEATLRLAEALSKQGSVTRNSRAGTGNTTPTDYLLPSNASAQVYDVTAFGGTLPTVEETSAEQKPVGQQVPRGSTGSLSTGTATTASSEAQTKARKAGAVSLFGPRSRSPPVVKAHEVSSSNRLEDRVLAMEESVKHINDTIKREQVRPHGAQAATHQHLQKLLERVENGRRERKIAEERMNNLWELLDRERAEREAWLLEFGTALKTTLQDLSTVVDASIVENTAKTRSRLDENETMMLKLLNKIEVIFDPKKAQAEPRGTAHTISQPVVKPDDTKSMQTFNAAHTVAKLGNTTSQCLSRLNQPSSPHPTSADVSRQPKQPLTPQQQPTAPQQLQQQHMPVQTQKGSSVSFKNGPLSFRPQTALQPGQQTTPQQYRVLQTAPSPSNRAQSMSRTAHSNGTSTAGSPMSTAIIPSGFNVGGLSQSPPNTGTPSQHISAKDSFPMTGPSPILSAASGPRGRQPPPGNVGHDKQGARRNSTPLGVLPRNGTNNIGMPMVSGSAQTMPHASTSRVPVNSGRAPQSVIYTPKTQQQVIHPTVYARRARP